MTRAAVAWLATALLFVAVDFVWLGVVARDTYRRHIGHLMAEDVNYGAAALVYVVLAAGAVVFAVLPAAERGSWLHALGYGALFGFFAYSIYDLTNLATLRDWPHAIVWIDVAWGTFLTGVASLAGYGALRLLG